VAEKALAATGVARVSEYTVTPSGQVSTRHPTTCGALQQQQQQNPYDTLSSIWTGSPTQNEV